MVVTVIVDAVRESSTQEYGGFVRKDLVSGRWYEVGDKIAREVRYQSHHLLLV